MKTSASLHRVVLAKNKTESKRKTLRINLFKQKEQLSRNMLLILEGERTRE